MRAPASAAFFLTLVGLASTAHAKLPALLAPKVSLALARDWKPITVAHRTLPSLSVTSAATPVPAQLAVAAYGRAEGMVRSVVTPYRSVSVFPFSPYPGAYGLTISVETNALLH